VLVAPIGPDGFAIVLAVACRATGIGIKDGVAICGEELSELSEFRVVGPYWPAVGAEDCREFIPCNVVERLIEVSCDQCAIFAFEFYVIRLRESELGKKCVVSVCDALELAVVRKIDLVGPGRCGDLSRYFPRFRN